jgi:hypothetical protein
VPVCFVKVEKSTLGTLGAGENRQFGAVTDGDGGFWGCPCRSRSLLAVVWGSSTAYWPRGPTRSRQRIGIRGGNLRGRAQRAAAAAMRSSVAVSEKRTCCGSARRRSVPARPGCRDRRDGHRRRRPPSVRGTGRPRSGRCGIPRPRARASMRRARRCAATCASSPSAVIAAWTGAGSMTEVLARRQRARQVVAGEEGGTVAGEVRLLAERVHRQPPAVPSVTRGSRTLGTARAPMRRPSRVRRSTRRRHGAAPRTRTARAVRGSSTAVGCRAS